MFTFIFPEEQVVMVVNTLGAAKSYASFIMQEKTKQLARIQIYSVPEEFIEDGTLATANRLYDNYMRKNPGTMPPYDAMVRFTKEKCKFVQEIDVEVGK